MDRMDPSATDSDGHVDVTDTEDERRTEEDKAFDIALGNQLLVRRTTRRPKWSQADIARETGYDKKTIGRIERGEKPMTVPQIHRIAKLFGLKPSELVKAAEQEVGIE